MKDTIRPKLGGFAFFIFAANMLRDVRIPDRASIREIVMFVMCLVTCCVVNCLDVLGKRENVLLQKLVLIASDECTTQYIRPEEEITS